MVVNKKVVKKQPIKSNTRVVRRPVRAAEEPEIQEQEVAEVEVAPEASDLLFEAEDVAELVAEVTGKEVAVTVDDDAVTFEVGEDQFVVEAEGDEEILESTRKPLRNKRPVKASTRKAVKPVRRVRR